MAPGDREARCLPWSADGLETIRPCRQPCGHLLPSHLVPVPWPFRGSLPHTLARPTPWRLWVPTAGRLDQRFQVCQPRRLVRRQELTAPPGRRTLCEGSWGSPAWGSSARSPWYRVRRDSPVAFATIVCPPWPSALASVTAQSRRPRSSSTASKPQTFHAYVRSSLRGSSHAYRPP